MNDKYQMNRNEINSNNNIEFILFYFRRKWKKNNVPIFDRNIRLIIELKNKNNNKNKYSITWISTYYYDEKKCINQIAFHHFLFYHYHHHSHHHSNNRNMSLNNNNNDSIRLNLNYYSMFFCFVLGSRQIYRSILSTFESYQSFCEKNFFFCKIMKKQITFSIEKRKTKQTNRKWKMIPKTKKVSKYSKRKIKNCMCLWMLWMNELNVMNASIKYF